MCASNRHWLRFCYAELKVMFLNILSANCGKMCMHILKENFHTKLSFIQKLKFIQKSAAGKTQHRLRNKCRH